MTLDQLIQNNKQYAQIKGEFLAGKNSHAYLIKSADSLFSEQICYALASQFTEASVARISKGIHPDVQIFGKNGKIDAAAAANIISGLAVACYEAEYKVYILLGVEDMNEAAQNKLLKSLEEPPSRVIFLLTATSTQNVLPTVLSRVNLVQLETLKTDALVELLQSEGVADNAAIVAAANSGGNYTLAKKLVSPDFLKMHQIALDALQNLSSSAQCLKYSSALEPKNMDKKELFDVFMLLLRDISMILSGHEELVVNKFCLDSLRAAAQRLNLVSCNKLIAECLICSGHLYYNTNQTAVLDKFLFRLAEEKSKCRKL